MNEELLKYIKKNRKKIGIYIIIIIFLTALGIFFSPTKLSKTYTTRANNTIYVAGDGSGDFNCDGNNDQVEINQALEYVAKNPQFTTVHLKGQNTYVISDSILIGSNTTLEGDPTAAVKLEDKADWPSNMPLITQMVSNGIQNVTIKGFEINGNHDNNADKMNGRGYYNMIRFTWSKSIHVYDMYMHDGNGDGLRIEDGSDIRFYDNKVNKLGHDGLFANNCENVEAWNNDITVRTDSGLRVLNSNHVKLHDNEIDSFYKWNAGGPGIQIEKSKSVVNAVEVYNNTIHDTYGPGILLIGYGESYPRDEAQNVHIHHNIFYQTGTNPSIDWVGGVLTSGFYDTLIENNVFDGVYGAAVTNIYPPVSRGVDPGIDLSPKGKGYTTTVRNNIIVNTQKRTKDPDGTGYGVLNYYPETSSFELQNNCLYNNTGGNYNNTNSTTDIYADPLFVNPSIHDYHLKPDSPCIGAGSSSSDSSNKSGGNSSQTNIGKYS